MPMGPGRTSPARRGHYPLPLNLLLLLAAQPRGVRPLASSPPPFPFLVPRIPASEYRSYRARHGPCVPVVLRGGSAGLPTPAGAERLAESLLLGLSGEEVVVQRRRRRRREEGEGGGGGEDATEWAAMTLGEAAGEAMDSDHWDAALAFCEGLLPPPGGGGEGGGRGAAEDLARTLRRAMGGPFRGGWGDDDHDDDDDNDEEEEEEDWFDHFPPEARPSDAVVLAGEGATSTLHRDPFEWTGTSLCLEGSKLWRFVLPGGGGVEEVDGALESYRLASVAWDGGGGGGRWHHRRHHHHHPPQRGLAERPDPVPAPGGGGAAGEGPGGPGRVRPRRVRQGAGGDRHGGGRKAGPLRGGEGGPGEDGGGGEAPPPPRPSPRQSS